MKKIILLSVVLFSLCQSMIAQSEDAYEIVLKEMMEAAGTMATFEVSVNQMFDMMKSQYDNVDDEIYNELKKEMGGDAINDFITKLVPAYKKHLSIEDLQGITAFYNTPLGKKFAEKTPLLTQEAMMVGQEWGMKIASDLANKMKQ